MSNTSSLDKSLANPVTEYLATNENRLGRIENKLTEVIEKFNQKQPSHKQITDLHKPKPSEAGEQSLDLPFSAIEKVKPLAERILNFIKSLTGSTSVSTEPVSIADMAKVISEFNKQGKTDEYMDFLKDSDYNPDQYFVHIDLVPQLITHFAEAQTEKLEPGSDSAKQFMKNMFTVFLSGRLEPDALDINAKDEEVKEWFDDLEYYFQSNCQSFGPLVTENLGEEGFASYAGLLIYLTYISAYQLAKEENIEVKYALDTRFNQLKLLCDKYELIEEEDSDFLDSHQGAIKLVDEFLASDETDLDDFKASLTHSHEIIATSPIDLIEKMVDSLKGCNTSNLTSTELEEDEDEPRNYDGKFTHLIRQTLSVLTAANVSKAKAAELYDWLLDQSGEVKAEKKKLMTEIIDLFKGNSRFEEHSVKVLKENFEKALVLVLDESLQMTGDLVTGFDQDKLAIIEQFKPD